MKKRILWLLNHTTLREFEVPLLVEMGYEIFTPKIYQYDFGDLSASVTWKYDETLTIPAEDLEVLNHTDFYQSRVSKRVVEIINHYFDVAFITSFPAQTEMLVNSFNGKLVFHAFGLLESTNYTRIYLSESAALLDKIRKKGDQFWFCTSYPDIEKVECEYFQRRTFYLPIGFRGTESNPSWVGGDNRILFVCPKIMTNPHFRNIYDEFVKNFGDIPHVIGGSQLIPVQNDSTVVGFLPKEQYEYNMQHLAAMFYHSQEPRHLQYHPLEAISNGMPLVFMAGGMLDSLGGKDLPGRCTSIRQAYKLLDSLSKGDKVLAQKIISSQRVLLERFSEEYCKPYLEQLMEQVENQTVSKAPERKKSRIAIVCPQGYTGGVLDFSIRLTLALQAGTKQGLGNIEPVFYYVNCEAYREHFYFKKLYSAGISVRSFEWSYKSEQWARNNESLRDYEDHTIPDAVYVMEDGLRNLSDCDYIIFTSDTMPRGFWTSLPYAVVVHDAIQRYVKELFDLGTELGRQKTNRKANAVIVTSEPMQKNAVQYVGAQIDKVFLMPQLFESISVPNKNDTQSRKYFHWGTNVTPHKNHKAALEGLRQYYSLGGTLPCVITGANTHLINPSEEIEETEFHYQYLKSLRQIIAGNKILKEKVLFAGELPKQDYWDLLAEAEFTFHPGYADNGNGVSVDAALLGVPTLSSDYPAMRYMNDRMEMQMTFFEYDDPESIANKLLFMEKNAQRIKKAMPSNSHFEQFTWQSQTETIYNVIQSIVRGY